MKILLYSVLGLGVIVSLYFVALSVSSRKQPELGVVDGQLHACPATPNCVSSESPTKNTYVDPLPIFGDTQDAWKRAREAIIVNGGQLMIDQDTYMHAYFETPVMRFIDDVELRLDENKQLIHIRSASRVGRSDLGANKVRVSKIREAFGQYSKKDTHE